MPCRAIRWAGRPWISSPLEDDAARLGGEKTGHQVEQGGLAGAVGADDRLDRAPGHPKADLLHGLEAAEGQADLV